MIRQIGFHTLTFLFCLVCRITSAQECNITWQNQTNTTFSGTTLTKTSGTTSTWNAKALSAETILVNSDGYVVHEVSSTDGTSQIGFSKTSSSSFAYVLYFRHNPGNVNRSVRATLNGANMELGQYNVGDKYRIRRTGNTVYVDKMAQGASSWTNGVHSASAYLSGTLPELVVDVRLATLNGTINGAKISCNLNAYSALYPNLSASFYRCSRGELKFKYTEDYAHNGDALEAKVYDGSNQLVQSLSLTKSTGINTYIVDLKASTNYTDGAYYVLQVTDLKKQTYYLRFRYED
jgi:hypothetical protein